MSGESTIRLSCKSTEVKRRIATEMRWNKYAVSLASPAQTEPQPHTIVVVLQTLAANLGELHVALPEM